jgi:hypothetical protein
MSLRAICGVFVVVLIVGGCAAPVETIRYESAYHAPLLSPGGQVGALPAAVQNTIRAETGSADISVVRSNHISGEWTYEVYYTNPEIYPPLYIAADGAVLRPDFSIAVPPPPPSSVAAAGTGPVTLTDLPGPVVVALKEEAPGAQIASMERETWGSRVVYIIGFLNSVIHPTLYITTDGTVLKESHR